MLGVDQWLATFHQDMQLYGGDVNELANNLLQSENPESQCQNQNTNSSQPNSTIVRHLRLSSAFFYMRQLPVSPMPSATLVTACDLICLNLIFCMMSRLLLTEPCR